MDRVKFISVPRCVYVKGEEKVLSYELNGSGDASKKAYCAVVYLLCRTSNGTYTNHLCSKIRVALLKDLSIPCLELIAARILATLVNNVRKALSLLISFDKIKC